MQPTYMPIAQIFGAQTRHTVPLFQRPYVWSKEEQWEPLWEDVLGLLERLEARQGAANVASHFLGTIVLEQAQNPTGSLPRREVIDGQQRLTTLQLLLKAAEHALVDAEASAEGEQATMIGFARRQLGTLTVNDAYQPEERYKVWPTNEDREPFRAVLDSDAATGPVSDARMATAYRFFRQEALRYLLPAGGTEEIGVRAQRFAAALKDYLKLIVLDLDPSDEPQAIFETLNAHGTPLLPADLIKNWLLWEASRQKLELGHLYEQYWRRFDRDHAFWRTRTGTGHAARARVDAFLQSWLTKETGEAISQKHLYDRFLRHIFTLKASSPSGLVDVEALMAAIAADVERFIRIDAAAGTDRFARFLQRLRPLDVKVLDPVLLALMGRPGTDAADLTAASIAIESYLVRRMVCGYQTRGYGALTLRLLKAMREVAADEPAATAIAGELAASVGGADSWPDDEEFGRHWRLRNFYNGLRRARTLMVLKALEESYQAQFWKGEPILTFDLDRLQIEHIMPQSWQAHWPVVDGVTPEHRTWALNGVGNLTLVSEKLNPLLSNGPWKGEQDACKRDGLRRHSKLEMNRRLLEAHEDWSDDRIAVRADELFDEARAIWPAFIAPASVLEKAGE
jgi:hypothetical protein